MKVFLLNPPDVENKFTDREDRHAGFASGLYPPYTGAQILSVLRKRIPGLELGAYDARIDNLPQDQIIKKVYDAKPDLVICLLNAYSIDDDRAYAELDIPTIGVICPSAVSPHDVLQQFNLKTAYFTKKEIENTVADAVAEFKENGKIQKTPGLVINTGDVPIDTGAARSTDIREFPVPAFDLFPMKEYFDRQLKNIGWHWEFGDQPYLWIVTSKGCIKRCTFCDSSVLAPKYKTPEQVVAEFKYYVNELGIRCFDIIDSEFTGNVRRAKEICRLLIKEKLDIKWVAHNIVELADDEMMRLMAEAGCMKLKYGLETADPAIQKRIQKPWSIEKVQKVFDATRKHGIKIQANFMVGFPGETHESIKLTYEALKTLKPDTVCSSILFPAPGAPLYQELLDQGLLLEKNWSNYKTTDQLLFKHEHYKNYDEVKAAWSWLDVRINRYLAVNNLLKNMDKAPPITKVLNVLRTYPLLRNAAAKVPGVFKFYLRNRKSLIDNYQ